MKKIVYISIIAALSIIMFSAVVSAGDNGWKHFQGTYAMSATGSCIHSENDFVWGNFIDAKPGVVYAGTTVSNGTWVFKKDGTGTYSYIMYATVTPPVQPPTCDIPGGIRIFEVNDFTFTYEVTHSGNITIRTQEGDTLEGTISKDNKTIVLLDDPHVKGPGFCPWYRIICTATRTLIRMH
jgi:hypothetical protein